MKTLKSMLLGLAVAGLVVAQPAAAQEGGDEFEQSLGLPAGSGVLTFALVLVGLVAAAGLAFEDDGDERPVSP